MFLSHTGTLLLVKLVSFDLQRAGEPRVKLPAAVLREASRCALLLPLAPPKARHALTKTNKTPTQKHRQRGLGLGTVR